MVELYFSAVTVISARPASSLFAAAAAVASLEASAADAHSLALIPDRRPRQNIEFHRTLRRVGGQDAAGIGDSDCFGQPFTLHPSCLRYRGAGPGNALFP